MNSKNLQPTTQKEKDLQVKIRELESYFDSRETRASVNDLSRKHKTNIQIFMEKAITPSINMISLCLAKRELRRLQENATVEISKKSTCYMNRDFHFTSKARNGNVINFLIHITPDEILKDEDCDMVIRRIILDCYDASEKLSNPEIHINVMSLDLPGDKINYEIIEEPNLPVHSIAIKQFEKNKDIQGIISKVILPADKTKTEIGQLSLLERFAVIEKNPRGFLGRVKQIIAVFLSKILYPFHLLQMLWHALTNQSEKQLKWDLNLLTEICGTTPLDGMSMMHAMKYISTMLDREPKELADPVLQLRFKNGLKIAEDMDRVRKSFSKSKALKLAKDIQKSISGVEDKKILIPVGYKNGNKLFEAMLEVSKDPQGMYTVAFISSQEETRTLFDRSVGIEIGSQSLRREITNIQLKDLLAVIPTLVELQTSSECLKEENGNWGTIFFQTLKFENSTVEVGQTTEPYRKAMSSGHLDETISYVKKEKGVRPDDAKRFELAVRLRLFLDVCHANKKGFKDLKFWTSVRTTARHLAAEIEKEKSLLGSKTEQGIELTRIFGELKKLLDELDLSLPVVVNLSDKSLPLATGPVEAETYPETPLLGPIKMESKVYPKAEPPFAVFDSSKPLETIKNWGLRCRAMITIGGFKEAAMEAKLMAQMLAANMATVDQIKKEDTPALLAAFNDIGEAIARGAVEKEQSTLNDIQAMVIVNEAAVNAAYRLKNIPKETLDNFMVAPFSLHEELIHSDCMSDRVTLPRLNPNKEADLSQIPKAVLHPLLNLAKFTEMAVKGAELCNHVKSNNPIQFELEGTTPNFHSNLSFTYATPLPLRAPAYAQDLTHDITNRYVTEFCCLGCIRDNCPNYNDVPKEQHRFHPLYMLHNYVDTFCDKLTKKGVLKRDEITDLMYTQQTNQNANSIWTCVHHSQHGFDIANGFDKNDRTIQLMNTFMVYFEHPDFFKQPDLRWQFESKIFKYDALFSMLNNFNVYEPFFISILNKLSKEISISIAVDDQETAAYLMNICNKLEWVIKASTMPEQIKQILVESMPKDRNTTLQKWAKELVGKYDQHLVSTQTMVLPLVLQNFYKKFLVNHTDSCFDSEENLQLILTSIIRLERMDRLKKSIDPEIHDKYLQLASFILSKTKEKVSREVSQGDFVNKILKDIHPTIARLNLQWDPLDFPTFMALGNKGDVYQFDLTTGKIIHNPKQAKNLLDDLPDNVKKNPGVKRLFGPVLYSSWNIRGTPSDVEEKIISYSHNQFPDLRIVVKPGTIDPTTKGPVIFIERKIPSSNGKVKWITFVDFNTQVEMRANQNFSQNPDLPIKAALAIGDRTCWIDRAKKEIHVFDIDSNEPYAIIKLRNSKEKTDVADLHILESDLHLLKASDKAMEQYSSIEDPNFIQVLGRKKKALQVGYPRYEMASGNIPLTYDIGKKGITTAAFPNYKLAPRGVRPGSADPVLGVMPLPATFDAFQLLQKDGDEKVLIPLREFEQQYSASGTPLPSSKMVLLDEFKKCPVYEFSVDRETNRLVAKSGDAYAYLAYLSLAHWDYSSAMYYLSKAKTTSGYDERYDQIFKWAQTWNDDTSNGIAMKLRFELFHEKVLEDRQIHQIREGRLEQTEQIAIQKAPRLIGIADLYEKYAAFQAGSVAGENGMDPSLELSFEDRKTVKRLIKTLLDSHGNEVVDTREPKPIRAEEIPLQRFKNSDTSNEINISVGTMMVWAFNGTDKNHSPFVLKDPRWVIKNFQDLFNQIILNDVNSIGYKQLKLQIRFISELSRKELNPIEASSVEMAQSYLLKLITVKESDPQGFLDLKNILGSNNKLPKFHGPFFTINRLKAIEKMEDILAEFNKYDLRDASLAKTKAAAIIQKIHDEQIPNDHDLLGLANKIFKATKEWSASQQSFYDYFSSFLKDEIFGIKGAKSIDSLDQIFKFLDAVEIKQPEQTMLPQVPQQSKPTQTYSDKYKKLADAAPVNFDSRIGELEKEIAARPEPAKARLISTDASKIQPVIGQDLVDRYSQYFQKTEVASKTIHDGVFDDLSRSKEKTYVRVAKKHREDLAAYVGKKSTVSLTKKEAKKLKEELAVEKNRVAIAKEDLKKDLLQYVEHFETAGGILAMRRLVGKGVKPSLESLIALWRRGETANAWKEHPLRKLGMKEIPSVEKLDDSIAKYLELSTTLNHLNRVGDMAESYLNSCGKAETSLGDAQLANELYDGVQTKRNYALNGQDNADYRDLLYVEYTQKIIMYADQIQTLREMEFNPNAVRQLKMGRGKTEVILPMLAKKKATGKNLVVLMLPEELYEANCRGLDVKNRLLFGQEMHRFDFDRKTDKSVEALKKIHLRLLQTIHEKGFIMSTKRSILCLKNSYVLLLNKLNKVQPHDDKSEVLGQIREMNKIISLFYNHADVLADEVDACLDVRKEVNFALGENVRIDQIKGDIGAELLHMILDQKPGGPLYELKDALIHNAQAALSPEKRQQLLATLAGIYYDRHAQQISAISKDTFVKYMMDDPAGAKAEAWLFKQKQKNNPLFKQIATLKGLLGKGFGTTLGKIGNVNYGRDPISGIYTIPYKASNTPSINSEFDDDIERICFTYQDYIQNGVSFRQVYQILAMMRKEALAEMRSKNPDNGDPKKIVKLNDTQATKDFKEFLKEIDPEGKLRINITLANVDNPEMVDALVKVLNSTAKGRLAFCHKVVVRNMKQYSAQIDSKSLEGPECVNNFGGFTGTPWNIHTYHDKINAERNIGVDGVTWALLLGGKINIKTFAFDSEKPIDSLLSNLGIVGNYQAGIDTGAYLRGVSNHEFIEQALAEAQQKNLQVNGIYFDESGKIVKQQGEGKPLPIEIAPSTDLMTNITLYDQGHTVGADIKQGKKAKSVMSIGENTFIREEFQGFWRMREVDREQTVDLAVSDKVKERILGSEERELTIDDIQKFCLTNEARREAEDNFKAEKEKIRGYNKRALLPEIAKAINNKASDETILRLAQKFASEEAGLFIKVRPKDEAYDDYARIITKGSPLETFSKLKAVEKAKSQKIAEEFKQMKLRSAAAEFSQIANRISTRPNPPLDWFFNEVESHEGCGTEVEAEAEQEVQAEVEQEAEVELEVNVKKEVQLEVQAEYFIPIVQTGAAGHGDVSPLTRYVVENLICQKIFDYRYFRKLSDAIPYFDDQIICSAIFERNLTDKPAPAQSVFYSNRKPVKQVLIAKNEKGEWTMLIPTIHEAHGACREFVTETKSQAVEVAISPGSPLILYKSGENRTEVLPFTDEADKENFYRLYIQAKLFNGETEFRTKDEQEALKKWLTEKGPVRRFRDYFEQKILGAKPRRFAEGYPKSSLFKIFNDLMAAARAGG